MRIVHVLFLLFIGSFANGQASKSPVITRYIKLTGTIDKFPVTFHLHRANDAFSGKYYYHSSEQPIDISGKLGKNGTLKLTGYGDDQENSEVFEGAFKDSVYAGTWKFKGKVLGFRAAKPKDTSGLSFDYIWTTASKKIKPAEDMPSHLDEISFEAAAVWPAAKSTHRSKQLIQQVVRELVGSKDSNDEIGKTLIAKKNSVINQKTDDIIDYDVSETIQVVYSSELMICLSDNWSNYTGGAHGMYGTTYVNIDLQNNRKFALPDILDTLAAKAGLEKLLEQQFRKKYPGDENEKLEEILFVDKIPMTENFMLTGKGIGFNYQPYEIGAYALGEIFLFISFKDLQPWLTPSFKKHMGW